MPLPPLPRVAEAHAGRAVRPNGRTKAALLSAHRPVAAAGRSGQAPPALEGSKSLRNPEMGRWAVIPTATTIISGSC
jgi:hypothetical protein